MTMAEIAAFGSINMDLVTQVEKFPLPGETITARGFSRFPGGKGANQAVAAARLGGNVTMFGMVGDDPFGKELVHSLEENGVQVERVVHLRDTPSGIAVIMVDEKGENMIAITAGANERIDQEYVEHVLPEINRAKILLLQLEVPPKAIDALLQELPHENPLVILDPAPATKFANLARLERVDIITPNLGELELLTGKGVAGGDQLKQVAAQLVEKFGVRRIICKAGAQGSYLIDKQEGFVHVPAPRVEVVDTTAAGDAFNGGLAVALSRGENLKEGIRYANAAGALAVTRRGAQPSMPTAEEVQAILGKEGP